MSKILFIHKKNNNIKFQEYSKQLLSYGTKSLCLSKIGKDFLIDSIETADYLFVNLFRKQIRGFATVYHDNYDGKHLHISLICNAKTHRMLTRKNINTPKLAGKNIIDAILKYGKQIKVKDVRLDAIKEVIPYYYKLGFTFENSQNNTETEKTLVKELQKAQSNNNKPLQKKTLEKIVLKFYTGYFNEKMQHDMGKNTDGRISYAMDYGIPMKFVFKTTSICKGKSIKNPNRCRKYKTCKIVHGPKRSYCRKNKNTRKKQTGGLSKQNISKFDYKSFVAEHKDALINILLESVDNSKITKKYVASKEDFNNITQKISNYLLKNQKGGATTPPTTPRGTIQPTIEPPNTSFTQENFQNIHDILQQHILDGPYGFFQQTANRDPFHILNMDPLFNVSCILFELFVLSEYDETSYSLGIIPLFIISGFALHLQLNHGIGNWRQNR